MATYLAAPPGDACFEGVKHEGVAKGEMIDVGGYQTYVTYPPSKSTDKLILYYCDVHGPYFINNRLLMDWFAEHGYFVVSPDYFLGEQLEEIRKQPGFDHYTWVTPHRVKARGIAIEFEKAIKDKYGPKKVGVVGYCFGGPMVTKALSTGVADAGAFCHPSQVTEDDLKAVKSPLLMSCAEVDSTFPTKSRHRAEEILIENKTPYHEQLFGGVTHGFAVRGNMDNENERWAKEQSAWGILAWFDRWLK